jgi:drug/metabolite transporter (DMT)-like permease
MATVEPASGTRSLKQLPNVAWIYVAVTLGLTVYGQLTVKWRVLQHGRIPEGLNGRATYLANLLIDPWVLSALLAAFIAALAWMAALSRLEISRAYPFMGLSFVVVLLMSGVFFGETITTAKIAGVLLVVTGIAVGAGLG